MMYQIEKNIRRACTAIWYAPLCMLMALCMLGSCSEDADDVDEYANWEDVNNSYWNTLYAETQQRVANGDDSWKLIPNYSLVPSGSLSATDYIIVHELEKGEDTESPLFTDSVRIHYAGHLLPSASYSAGYRFDGSYSGIFNPATARPASFAVNGLIDGWQTALQHMHVGDRWEVYIPYTLAYGKKGTDNGTIPGYSTLIFDMSLVSFWHVGDKVAPLLAPRKPVQ